MSVTALHAGSALAGAGFRRWATYRQAAVAGAFTNCVFGVVKVSALIAVAASAGGVVGGYDRLGISTYTWVSQSLIAVVVVFTWTELAERIRSGDIAVDLARPVDLQLSWLAQDLGRAGFALLARAIPPLVVGALVFGLRVPSDPTAVALLPVSVLLAVAVSFACRFLVNLAAFWLLDVRGVVTLYVLVSNLLAGLVTPVQLAFDGSLPELVSRVGAERELVVDLAAPGPPLRDVPGTTLRSVEADGLRQRLAFRAEETTAAAVIAAVSDRVELRDLAITEPGIEHVVRRLYERSAGAAPAAPPLRS